jgi:hypothetical protein
MRSPLATTTAAVASAALTLAFPLCALVAGCASAGAHDPNAPLSAAAQKVEVVKIPPVKCKKLGSATGQGRDLIEATADKQATDAAREQTAKLGGDTALVVTETTEQEAGSGGTYAHVTKIIEVYKCGQ